MNLIRIYLLVIICAVEISIQEDRIPKVITRFIEKCTEYTSLNGIMSCITEKSLEMVMKASQRRSLQVLPGFEIVRNPSGPQKILNIKDLPTDPEKKEEVLLELLVNATSRFISDSSLKVELTSDTALEEGRGKKKKMDFFKLGLGAIMLTIVPITLGGIGFISAKALVVGKIALVLSIVLFVQGFFSGGRNMLPISYGYGTKPSYGYNTPSPSYSYGTNSLGGWNNQQDGFPYARSMDDGASTVSGQF